MPRKANCEVGKFELFLSRYNTPMLSILPIADLGWLDSALVNYLAEVLPRCRLFVAPVCSHFGQRSDS
jgi:hypothetical protein